MHKKLLMLEWYNTLAFSEQLFWVIAIVSTIVFIFAITGAYFHQNKHRNRTGELQLFKFKNLSAFFFVFGWVGIASLYQNFSLIITLIIAFVCGLVMMFVMAGLFYYVKKMTEGGTVEFKNEINTTGEVFVNVGRKRSTIGKVQIKAQGIFKQMDALTDFDHDIVKGTLIQIESVNEDGILIIKPLQ